MSGVPSPWNESTGSTIIDGKLQPARLLSKPFGVSIMGIAVDGNLYAQNSFRFLGASANVDDDSLERAIQRVCQLQELSRAAMDRMAIHLGYDAHLGIQNVADCVTRLNGPQWRTFCEIFWPHVNGTVLATAKKEGCLTNQAVVEELVRQRTIGHSPMLTEHAMAIVYHNLALTEEIEFLTGQRDQWPQEHWTQCLTCWANTLATRDFWDYVRTRVADRAPLVKPEDVDDQLVADVANAVLGFNSLLATTYARTGQQDIYREHQGLITSSGLAQPIIDNRLTVIVQGLTQHQLEPLVQRAKNPEGQEYFEMDPALRASPPEAAGDYPCPRCGYSFAWDTTACAYCGFSTTGAIASARPPKVFPAAGKTSWRDFAHFYDPLVCEAEALCRLLGGRLGVRDDLVRRAGFDALCGAILDATHGRIDYTQEREPAIFYSLVTGKRMSRLPLSPATRRTILQSAQSDVRCLYGPISVPADLDLGQCWFLEGEPADPESSILIPVHKILCETIRIVRYESCHILVPRSRVTKARHEGQIRDGDVASKRIGGSDRHRRVQQAVETKRQEQEQIRRSCEEKTRAAQHACESQICSLDATAAPQAKEDRAFIKKQQNARRAGYAKLDAQHDAMIKQIDQQFGPQLDEYRQVCQLVHSQVTGWTGFLRIRLLCMSIGSALLALVAVVLAILTPLSIHVVWPAVVPGLWGGFVVGKRIAGRRLGVAGEALDEVQSRRDDKIKAAEAQRDEARKKIELAYKQAAAGPLRRLGSHKVKLEKMKADLAKSIEQLHSTAETQIRKLDEEIKRLWSQLDSHIKPESHKNQFPIYRNSRSGGYNDGWQPPAGRPNARLERLLDSLTDSERNLLALLQKHLSEDQFGRCLEMLDATPGNRMQVLLSFMKP